MPTPTPTQTQTVEPTPTHGTHLDELPVNRIHVETVTVNYESTWYSWHAIADVVITDSAGEPVEGATVDASWSGAYEADTTCVTGSDGHCSIQSIPLGGTHESLDLLINGIWHPTGPYDARENQAPTMLTGICPQRSGATASATWTINDDVIGMRWVLEGYEHINRVALYRSADGNPEKAARIAEQSMEVMSADIAGVVVFEDTSVEQAGIYTYWLVAVKDECDVETLGSVTIEVKGPKPTTSLFVPFIIK